MRVAVSLGLGVIALAMPAAAQVGPSFDCAKASSPTEVLICENTELARLDGRLAKRFDSALVTIRAMDTGATEAEDTLQAQQAKWIETRDACMKDTDPRSCVETAYLTREGALVARWMLEEPERIVTWNCGESGTNEVVTKFFDTELPSVRFERGDSTDVGALSPTGSGSRFEGSAGRYIWIQGSEAIYRDPEPNGRTSSCELAGQD